ncbi:hypothetical protein FRC12_017474 [Ceratobasidium sp. 428]|nr:hypothetical protein FRC12_017474 [Ceratobasidium sp. 428]
MDRLPTAQLDEFACRQLDRFEQRYGSRTDSPRDEVPRTPTPRSQPTPDADSGPGRGRSLERRIPGSAAGATLLRSPTPSATRDDNVPNQDAGSGVVVPAAAAATNDSDRQVANRSRWQAMLLEAGGIGAALSDESMKRLKYCLQWLQVSTFDPYALEIRVMTRDSPVRDQSDR